MILPQETAIVATLAAMLGLALCLLVTAQPIGRPRPALRDILRRMDAEALARADLARSLGRTGSPEDGYRSSAIEAALRPLVEEGGRILAQLLAVVHLGPDAAALELRLARAGTPMSAARFMGQQLASGLVLALVFPALNVAGLHPFGPWPLWLGLAAFGVGYTLPLWMLGSRIAARRQALLLEIPSVLDDVLLGTSAGLSVEAALVEVAERGRGELAVALRGAIRDIRLGHGSAVDALADAAQRLESPELEGAVAALRLAHERGASLAGTLRAQAHLLRERRRLLIVEAGGVALVRMTLIVGFTTIPALVLALVYPAVVRLLSLGDV